MKNSWPVLSYKSGKPTYDTLHMWTQIVGKIKLAVMPWTNHSWHIALHISSSGLSTLLMPYKTKHFQIDFNFITHQLEISTSLREHRMFSLKSISVADFYSRIFQCLKELDIEVTIRSKPVEITDPIPFTEDTVHATYVPEHAIAFYQALVCIYGVLLKYRARFKGKSSPIHFFWGSFDLAHSRFCGRSAPKHPGGVPNLPDWVAQEAYSDEVGSCGFWTGNEMLPEPAFYAYVYPEPEGYSDSTVTPAGAYYHKDMHEFILPYSVVQQSDTPDETLLGFFESTYASCASLAEWNRKDLEMDSQL